MKFLEEVKMICGINERFDLEDQEVQAMRENYACIAQGLVMGRNAIDGTTKKKERFQKAIDALDVSCMMAVKALYLK